MVSVQILVKGVIIMRLHMDKSSIRAQKNYLERRKSKGNTMKLTQVLRQWGRDVAKYTDTITVGINIHLHLMALKINTKSQFINEQDIKQ